jgi:hypothetical protein
LPEDGVVVAFKISAATQNITGVYSTPVIFCAVIGDFIIGLLLLLIVLPSVLRLLCSKDA